MYNGTQHPGRADVQREHREDVHRLRAADRGANYDAMTNKRTNRNLDNHKDKNRDKETKTDTGTSIEKRQIQT